MLAVHVRVLGWLERQGVKDASAELGIVDDELAEREPALAALARASALVADAGHSLSDVAELALAPEDSNFTGETSEKLRHDFHIDHATIQLDLPRHTEPAERCAPCSER